MVENRSDLLIRVFASRGIGYDRCSSELYFVVVAAWCRNLRDSSSLFSHVCDKATSPALVKNLGFEGENARDKVRRLMDELVVQHKVKETKLEQADEIGRKGQFVYEVLGNS